MQDLGSSPRETEEIVNRVSFEFSRLGSKKLEKKARQTMDTETPLMLLFVCNGTEQASVMTDTKQMLDLALDDIKRNGMLPEEFEGKDIFVFTIHLNVPRVPSSERKPTNNKGYDHYKEHGKKAFHFEVAKDNISFFKYLLLGRMGINMSFWGQTDRQKETWV
jgi:hypothetical protein